MTEAARKPPAIRRYISLRVKLLVGFTLLFGVVFALAFAWFYTFASGVAEARLTDRLYNSLIGTAASIDGDVLIALYEEAEVREDGYTDDTRYWEIADWLYTVHEIDSRAWPYTFVRGEQPDEVVYVVSSGAVDPEGAWGVTFKQPEIATLGIIFQGFVEPTTYLDQPYEWEGSWWVSGYAPIRSHSTGEIVAGLGIDYNFDYVIAVRNTVRDQAIPAFVITYSVLFILIYLVSNYFTRPIAKVTRVAERIGEGDYNVDLSELTVGRFPDEITTLAQVFDSMTRKVEKREVELKERVAELEITLDLNKRDQQVAEIVDSDFFQDLQVKAREMRERKMRSPRQELPTEDSVTG